MTDTAPAKLFEQPTQAAIAHRLREIRREKGWSLNDVEILSRGSIKAVVLGSYERCDRALSIQRAIQLATFFDVPFSSLFGSPNQTQSPIKGPYPAKIVLDLRALKKAGDEFAIYIDFSKWIIEQRSDWNGEVLSIRESDLDLIAILNKIGKTEVVQLLFNQKFILTN